MDEDGVVRQDSTGCNDRGDNRPTPQRLAILPIKGACEIASAHQREDRDEEECVVAEKVRMPKDARRRK